MRTREQEVISEALVEKLREENDWLRAQVTRVRDARPLCGRCGKSAMAESECHRPLIDDGQPEACAQSLRRLVLVALMAEDEGSKWSDREIVGEVADRSLKLREAQSALEKERHDAGEKLAQAEDDYKAIAIAWRKTAEELKAEVERLRKGQP